MKTILTSALLLFALVCNSQVDYRNYQSPVKNQQSRGTCTAFAVMASLETVPGFPSDLSEQYAYANVKLYNWESYQEYNQGGSLQFYTEYLETFGAIMEEEMPYDPTAPVWGETATKSEKMREDIKVSLYNYFSSFTPRNYKIKKGSYNYLQGKEAQNIEAIKDALDNGQRAVPVSYFLNVPYWFNHPATADNPIDVKSFLILKNQGKSYGFNVAKLKWGNSLFEKIQSGEVKPFYKDMKYNCDAGHAVAIVGYNDKGFLIKNSWGTDTWDNGYGWISYDYHRIFAQEALFLRLKKIAHNRGSESYNKPFEPNKFYLKTLPDDWELKFANKKGKGLNLSFVYHSEGRLPEFEKFDIEVYNDGELVESTFVILKSTLFGLKSSEYGGFQTNVLVSENNVYPTADKVVIHLKTKDGNSFTNTYYNLKPKNQEHKPQ